MSTNNQKITQSIITYPGGGYPVKPTLYGFTYDGLLSSESHWKLPDGTWSGGGPFYVRKRSLTSVPMPYDWVRNNVHIFGSAHANGVGAALGSAIPTIPTPPSFASVSVGLQADYTKGYARTRPGNPVAHVGQFVGELLLPNGLPRVPIVNQSRLSGFRRLGDEYLNVAFGWIPFVRDLQQMYYLWHNLDKRLAQIVRDNGRGIHRKATILDDVTTTNTAQTSPIPFDFCINGPSNWGSGSSFIRTVTKTTDRRWYAAKYQYYIPDIGSSQWTKKATRALFGANLTPDLAWELLPWSWLIDWFGNVGDVISNASSNAVDNLTTKYSYIMKHTSTEVTASVQTEWNNLTTSGNLILAGRRQGFTRNLTETKLRLGGLNPFGLGIQVGSLSNYQLGILAALGLSRDLVK